jgi:hypothetical protein
MPSIQTALLPWLAAKEHGSTFAEGSEYILRHLMKNPG